MAWQLVGSVLEHHPALPDRQFRVLLSLAHAAPVTTRRAAPGLPVLMHQANCSDRTARRTLDGLCGRGLIKKVGGYGPGHAQVYELIGLEPVWTNGDANTGHPGDHSSSATQMTDVEANTGHPGDRSNTGHSEATPAISGQNTGHPGGRPTDTELLQTARARDNDAQPDWRRGPRAALEGRVWPPGSRGADADRRPTPQPPAVGQLCPRGCGKAHRPGACPLDEPDPWNAPRRDPNPEVAHQGRAAVNAAVAAARAESGQPPPRAPLTDDDRRAVAARQAAAARAERLPAPQPDPLPEPAAPLPPEPPQHEPPEPSVPAPWQPGDDDPW